jgi:hypothetical protein
MRVGSFLVGAVAGAVWAWEGSRPLGVVIILAVAAADLALTWLFGGRRRRGRVGDWR